MCTSPDHAQGEATRTGAGRRAFLRATALLGAAAGTGVALPAVAEAATGSDGAPTRRAGASPSR